MTTPTQRTELAQELHDEGLPNPWRKASSPAVPNPWAGIVNEPGDPKTIPIVKIDSDGKAWANSRDVAAYFGKEHYNVLKAIDALLEQDPATA
ncbi:Rha family transcriptional regulator [Xanthobacter sp. NFM-26]|uniref:Rha family transcriptional regulator n=1 Tax=Xanthobacter sp. NFM-26 TaxID=2744461 RepID=UPI001EDF0F4C|nr:Rha family transcriptional regulator [Xanthobacter sp. NFM-26]